MPPTVKTPLTAIVLAVIILAVERILVQLFVAVLYWYDTWLTTVICPFVGEIGNAILKMLRLCVLMTKKNLFYLGYFGQITIPL